MTKRLLPALLVLAAVVLLLAGAPRQAERPGCDPERIERLHGGLRYAEGFAAALSLNPAAKPADLAYQERQVAVTEASYFKAYDACR